MLSDVANKADFRFEILYQSKRSRARVGRIITPHGVIETPNFVAVGTNGSLKTLHNHDHEELDIQLMFCNTYHLMVQPGTQLIKESGGLHTFIQRQQPIITDSGGFQVFSLAYGNVAKELKGQGGKKHPPSKMKVTEEGVVFRSYRDGTKIFLSPETSVQAQKDLGADIIIPLDELLPFHVDEATLKASFARTHRWELRSLAEHLKARQNQAMFAVIHGGTDLALRQQSCQLLTKEAFDGFAIGGSLGRDHQELHDTVGGTTSHLPTEKPIHLLGIGDVTSINHCIPFGIDTFDSSYPSKVARHGMILTAKGPLKITRTEHARERIPLEHDCPCPTCKHYTRAYLHHLFKAKEPSAASLATWHNIRFMTRWMSKIRTEILCGLL
ncbi:tRNA guanosine(34) transglycosylase Tgt [Candidatus Berkiella aquae]|uniref:Queuine tRNA-ribosyltransferase n=1 Tax=Candidatus Berkiella aquae TaxID=295108 RepID=A0A0Q9YNF5_9GAMM|nr:tRNA guanosine(34) transglycosylase Tgt [Candidatus Berkiella aquae]MCS5712473.1 tRNA-guanosine(34) transglycosylase [Candidatus Berkiella aquae]